MTQRFADFAKGGAKAECRRLAVGPARRPAMLPRRRDQHRRRHQQAAEQTILIIAVDREQRSGQEYVIGEEEHQQPARSEEHTSELQSLMRISYAVFCLKKKKKT